MSRFPPNASGSGRFGLHETFANLEKGLSSYPALPYLAKQLTSEIQDRRLRLAHKLSDEMKALRFRFRDVTFQGSGRVKVKARVSRESKFGVRHRGALLAL